MRTNQKFHSLRVLPLICLLLFTIYGIGQNFISNIKQNGNSIERLSIKITPPKGQPTETLISKKSPIESGSILEIPSKVIVFITSINGNIGQITGPNTVEFTATKTGEKYRVIDGSGTNNVFIKVFKQLTGGVLASGPTGEIHARSRLTEFLLAVNEIDANFELIKGKIDINRRQKVEIKDENKIDSVKTRILFITETTKLDIKGPNFKFITDSLKITALNTETEIDSFFGKQISLQKRMFTKTGSNSRRAFNLLENGEVEKGKELLDEAYKSGEIRLDFIVQSSLMLTDTYFRQDELEKSRAWLEAGLHFSENFYKTNKEKYDHYSKLGNTKITKAFGYDMIVANEYYVWAYTLKSRINGCLENERENPSLYRRQAKVLKKEVSNF
jgi:hypothetical protein